MEKNFDESQILHELKHYLPSQTPIKDFIHHNSLHAFQQKTFFEAIFLASKTFGMQATLELIDFRVLYEKGRISDPILNRVITKEKGEKALKLWKEKLLNEPFVTHNEPRINKLRSNWKPIYGIDLENLVQPIFFRILSNYLDQGISNVLFPKTDSGFIDSIKSLENNLGISFFKSKRAKEFLRKDQISIEFLLKILVGDSQFFEQYLFDLAFSHQGWSGLVSAVEDWPDTLLDPRKISLKEIIQYELLLEIDNLDYELGQNWQPLSAVISQKPTDLFEPVPTTEYQEVLTLWQKAFEWEYYNEVILGLRIGLKTEITPKKQRSFQALFCIDERECSIRRHIEAVDSQCETFGTPGFFTVEFYFKSEGAQFYEKLCPAPVFPKYLIKEYDKEEKRGHELLYHSRVNTFLSGTLHSFTAGFYAVVRLVQQLFFPKMTPAISDAFAHNPKKSVLMVENKSVEDTENGLQIGYTIHEMATRVEALLRSIGLLNDFAPIIYLVAHGSSSANNPHHSAHDCGACSGRPGSANARVMATMANHPKVREILAEKGIIIPVETQFIGSMHDTAADQIQFYDTEILTVENVQIHQKNVDNFEHALDLNAKERSRRFASINTKKKLKKVRKEILRRSVSMFEPRPELGHGTNSLCIVGRRDFSKNVFLDRRAFMNSYDYRTDPEGKYLVGVMRPIGLVCGGINLEYYFSRVDNYKMGAGTKLPHNVVGLFGVANSSDGDLRPGLPLQMIEVHDPVRLLVLVEHRPEIVLKTIQSDPGIYEWYNNDWVHIMAINPDDGQFYYFENEAFHLYKPLEKEIKSIDKMVHFIEAAKEMKTNHITHATFENLPVHSLKN